MSKYRLTKELYIVPTPAGAYYGVSRLGENPYRGLIQTLLSQPASPPLTTESLKNLTGLEAEEEALDLLYHIQEIGWIEGVYEPREAPTGTLEDILPDLLPELTGCGKILLADHQGFYVSSHGFTHEAAEELSALSADVASLDDRHHGLLRNNLGLHASSWALVDAAGNSEVGFWPLYIGSQRFVLIINGLPRLNQPVLTKLIWALSIRYAA